MSSILRPLPPTLAETRMHLQHTYIFLETSMDIEMDDNCPAPTQNDNPQPVSPANAVVHFPPPATGGNLGWCSCRLHGCLILPLLLTANYWGWGEEEAVGLPDGVCGPAQYLLWAERAGQQCHERHYQHTSGGYCHFHPAILTCSFIIIWLEFPAYLLCISSGSRYILCIQNFLSFYTIACSML